MLLLIGPPGAGKTTFCVERMRESLRTGDGSSYLLLPTTTLAEHLRNQLAREGFVFSPRRIATFGKYIGELARDITSVTTATLEILTAEILDTLPLDRYAAVRDFRGFRGAVVRAIEEYFGAGGTEQGLDVAEPDFRLIVDGLRNRLASQGLRLRSERLQAIAARLATGTHQGRIFLTGFFNFTPPEIAVLRELAAKSNLVVTLPDSASAITALATFAGDVRTLDAPPRSHTRVHFTASTQDAEAVEIARRIVEAHRAGRAFRDIGVVVRSEQPSVPALRVAFERFGIPARFYFARPLAADPTVSYLSAILNAALGNWDHEQTLDALRSNGSPVERWGDYFEHQVRKQLPNRGLERLRSLAPEWTHWFFDELSKLDAWRTDIKPPVIWRERFLQLPSLFRPPAFDAGVSHERVLIWRAQSTAIEHFNACVVEAAEALGSDAVDCRTFWDAVQTTIDSASMHIVDRRRDVVHVIDAVEARQWRLPVVFVCGLLEGEFPKHYAEDPILPDAVRATLKSRGIPVRTSIDRQHEEALLFETCLSRATEQVFLSYAVLNGKGEPNLPSFFLERAKPFTTSASTPVRPRPQRSRAPEPHAVIYSDHLREVFASRHTSLSASAIESYLQCPFNLFITKTLKLAEPPCGPWDRLNPLVQGNIAHKTLELHYRDALPLQAAFDQAFDHYAAKEIVPAGYRTEAVRLELFISIQRLVERDELPRWRAADYEKEFDLQLGDLTIKGRIDRIELDEHGNAFVIDYKYQTKNKIKETVAAHEDGRKVQGGVYLLGAEKLGYKPAGMVFCGFKQDVHVDGWVQSGFAPEIGIQSSHAAVANLRISAREAAMQMVSDLRNGRIAPEPDDDSRCPRCTYLKICRVDARRARTLAGGGTQ